MAPARIGFGFRGVKLGFALGVILLSGCARLVVDSSPTGAEVLWSPDGHPPWRPWPPRQWASDTVSPRDRLSTPTTPLKDTGPYGDFVFITVRKPGYYSPRPMLAGLYLFRSTHLDFVLEETSEHREQTLRDKGLVPYRGEWVSPAEQGLIEYEGRWMSPAEKEHEEMTARGWKRLEGRWMSPEDYAVAYAASQRARGLVEFKNRWIAPEQQREEAAIDQAVESLDGLEVSELSPPKVLGQRQGDLAGIGLRNATHQPTRWLFSGPSSRWIDMPPGGEISPNDLALVPGRYTLAVFFLDPGDPPASPAAMLPEDLRVPPRTNKEAERPGMHAILPEHPAATRRNLLMLYNQPVTDGFSYLFSCLPPAPAETVFPHEIN